MQAQLKRRWIIWACSLVALLVMVGAALVWDGHAADEMAAWRRLPWRDRLGAASVVLRSLVTRHVGARPRPAPPSPEPGLAASSETTPLPMVMKPIITAPTGRAWLTKMRDQLCRCTDIECARTLQENYARSIGPVDLAGVDPLETRRLIHEASDCTARLLSGPPQPPVEEAGG